MYITGTVSIFLASKFVDCNSIKMDIVLNDVVHNKFTADELTTKESEVWKTIRFNPDVPTTFEFIELLCADFACNHKNDIDHDEWKVLQRVKQSSIYFAAMCCYDYSMLQFKYGYWLSHIYVVVHTSWLCP